MSEQIEKTGEDNAASCEWYEASIATALYEALPPAEQSHLEAHLLVCAACRATQAELRQLVADVPRGAVSEEADLWPALAARIAPRRKGLHWSLYAAAAMMLVVAGASIARMALLDPPAPGAQVAENTATGAVAQSLDRAKAFVASRDFSSALKELQGALAAHPADPEAGRAQMALAELEFSHGQRYAEAYTAYAALKEKYPAVWGAAPQNADRFDLLTEVKPENFEPLYALNAAKSSATDAFGQLERIAARPEGRLVAALAVDAMRELVGGAASGSGEAKVAALQQARDRCKDPVAAAQIKMALANTHWTELRDAETARALYGEVASATEPLVAQAARDALAKLDAAR